MKDKLKELNNLKNKIKNIQYMTERINVFVK